MELINWKSEYIKVLKNVMKDYPDTNKKMQAKIATRLTNEVVYKMRWKKDKPKPFKCVGESRTKSEFQETTDVNRILKNHMRNGTPIAPDSKAFFGDLTGYGDFSEMAQKVINARDAFGSLPSNVRTQFNNDPDQLIEALGNSANRKMFEDLGLIDRVVQEVETPQNSEIIADNLESKEPTS